MPELCDHLAALGVDGRQDLLPTVNLTIGVEAGAPSQPRLVKEMFVASEMMSPPSEARCA
jgi:hypothetical protein